MTYNATLIPFTEHHIARTFTWIQDKDFRRYFLMRSEPTWNRHFKHFKDALNDSNQYIYAIIVNGEHVGNCGLKRAGEETGELWIYIGDSNFREKGIGTYATKLLLSQAIDH